LLDFARIMGILAIITLFAGIIYMAYGEEIAQKTAQILITFLICVAAMDCCWQLLVNTKKEATDAVHNFKSTRNVLKNLCGAIIIAYYVPTIIWNSINDLYMLDNGNIFGIIALVFLVVVVTALFKKAKEPLAT